MRLRYQQIALSLRRRFTTAEGSVSVRNSLLVSLSNGGRVGLGEASPARMYGQTVESAIAAMPAAAEAIGDDPLADIEASAERLSAALPGQRATVAAVDAAMHDLAGRLAGEPVWRRIGAKPADMPVTSFTIGIDEPELIELKVRESADWPVLKIKLGTDNDEQIVRAVRKHTDATLRVDANGGWTLPQAVRMCRRLADWNVELVEQPLPRGRLDELADLKRGCPLPIFADEDCHTADDIERLAGRVDGVNLKLSKAGGISGGLRLIRAARAAGLKVMVGCMIESSVGIAAGAALAPLCDLADLDGHLLLAEDIAAGLDCCGGKLVLTDEPGLGVRLVGAAGEWIDA